MHAHVDSLQPVFRALSDPTRRQILADLDQSEWTVADVAARHAMTRVAVRKHLTVLEQGGLIDIRPEGRERRITLRPARLKAAHDWLGEFSRFWDDRLAALKTAVESENERDEP